MIKKLLICLGLACVLAKAQQPVKPVDGSSNELAKGPTTTVTWTSATAQNATSGIAINSWNAVLVEYTPGAGTVTGGVLTFEDPAAIGNSSGVPAQQCYRMTSNASETTYTLTTAAQKWQCPVGGVTNFQVRLSTAMTGTASFTISVTPYSGQVHIDTIQLSGGGNTIGAVTQGTTPWVSQPTVSVSSNGLISSTYLGTGSANTAKTTGAVTLTTPATSAMTLIVGIGCSGNFATSTWSAAITDSASNTYIQIGANSGTYPQANSTTQVCIPFIAKNTSAVTTITFTISGASSANTTVSVMAWGVAGAIPNFSAIDGWAPGTSSGATSLSTQIFIPSHSNELVIAGGCASTGTISLPSNSALTFDSGSVAIASGSNCVTAYGGSAVIGPSNGITGSFTDGSSAAYSEVAIILKGYDLTDTGIQHMTGNMINGAATNKVSGARPAITSGPPMWAVSNNPGSGSTASVGVASNTGKSHVLNGFCYNLNGDSTGAASTQIVQISDSTTTIFTANASVPSGISAVGTNVCMSGLSVIAQAGAQLTIQFNGNVAHVLEAVSMWGYDIDIPNVTY